jgi:hypothetical protein
MRRTQAELMLMGLYGALDVPEPEPEPEEGARRRRRQRAPKGKAVRISGCVKFQRPV